MSYAREDRKWADELMTFLSPWIRDKRVELWDDSRIPSGARWRDDIDAALDDAAVGVLLVSSHFLASPFIAEHELPVLLGRAERNQLRLFWIPVSHAPVTATGLRSIQAASDPARPLDRLPRPQRNKVLVSGRCTRPSSRITTAAIDTFAANSPNTEGLVAPLR